MEDKKVLEVVLREMKAYGEGWRMDWSGFDGRTLRDQLNSLAAWAVKAQKEEIPQYIEGSEFLHDII